MQSALDRRKEMLDALMVRRQDTIPNLASEFKVSERTVMRDLDILSHDYPIYTVQGNGGGVRVTDGYYASRMYLNMSQEQLLRRILPTLSQEDQGTMRGILSAFAKPQLPESVRR